MRFMNATYFFALFFAIPLSTHAAVVVNEIAWMGDATSPNHEWIELKNDGDLSVDLSGWTLMATDGSPAITLSGVIPPGGYFLLERTNDESVPQITADHIYTGALSNTGETLVLSDSLGTVQDTVEGGENWVHTGGDNDTKDTAQRVSSGWITGSPSPRAANTQAGASTNEAEASGTVLGASTIVGDDEKNAGGSTVISSYATSPGLSFPRPTITVSAGADLHAFTGFPVTFEGLAQGFYDEPIPLATYHWNFGDGVTGLGKTATHTYLFPGEYIATLEVFWGGKREQDRTLVFVENAAITIAHVVSGSSGYVEIRNTSSREMDAGGWRLIEGNRLFIIPKGTVIPAGKTLIIPNQYSGLDGVHVITLTRDDGFLLATWKSMPNVQPDGRENLEKNTEELSMTRSVSIPTISETKLSAEDIASTPLEPVLWERATGDGTANAFIGGKFFHSPLILMLTILVFSVLLLLLLRSRHGRYGSDTDVDQYAIIEEVIEGAEEKGQIKNG